MRIMKAMGFKNVKYLIGNYKQIKNVHIGIEDNKIKVNASQATPLLQYYLFPPKI